MTARSARLAAVIAESAARVQIALIFGLRRSIVSRWAAFCGVVGLRPTAGLVPRFPTPLPWDVGTVHGPMARTAEDAALLLEAMIDDSGLTPIAVRAPWKSPLATVAQTRDL